MIKVETEPYFGDREEKAVFDYITTDLAEVKNEIYNKILIEPFRKMNESILRKYPIHIGNYTMQEIEHNALTHLIEHMIKYRPYIIEKHIDDNDKWVKLNENYRFFYSEDAENMLESLNNNNDCEYRIFYSKAYSYCQTIIRNYYKDHGKKTYSDKKITQCYDDYADDINENINYSYEIDFEPEHYLEKLIDGVINEIENVIDNSPTVKKNEIVVGDAVVNILKNWHILFMEDSPDGKFNKRVTNKFQKNKVLLFLKEQTGLSTKEIRMAIKPFKEMYFFQKFDYFND